MNSNSQPLSQGYDDFPEVGENPLAGRATKKG